MDRKYNIQLNLSPYANVYEDGGLVGRPNGVQLIPIETKGISPSDAVNPNNGNAEGGNKFLNFMNSSGGGGWAAAIGPAATNIANAFLDTEASTADRVAGALGIPALANQWRADTSKGDSYLKGMTSTLDSMSGKNYIQDASSTFGANNAVKLNNKQIISPISPASALPSLKDFKGNWWRNMGASVVQGAAAGSVGGPWGAAGGALTGLLGSLGGLFGRKKQTEKAYEDFLHKRDTLMSAQQNAFNTAVKNRTLSNMQALANGNMSQRINDMANIRAYGGNLYPDGGAVNIADLFQNAVQKSAFTSLYDPYTIKKGETLSGIASRNNISLEDLINSNPEITNSSMINVGQQINLPVHFNNKEIADDVSDSLNTPNFLDYTVKQGDYMSKIAKSNNTTLEELQKANPQIKDFNRIFVGDTIHIPQNTTITAPAPKRMSLSERRTFEEEANKTNLGAIQGYRHDNNYAVIDKKNKTVTVYSPTNEVLYQSNEINTGLSGDDYNTITYTDKSEKIKDNEGNMSTPAGITEISGLGTYHSQPSYIRKRVGDETDIASSFHAGNIKKGSNGCVRMSDKTLQDLQQFLNKGTRVYTLPEKDGSKFVLKDGKLSFQADNPYGETDGSKKYWDDYNVYNDKTSGDLFISPNENFKNKYKDTEKLGNAVKFGNTLSENKEELQKYLGLSSGVYNDLAQLAMGIADQETKFGSSAKYSFKSNMPWLVNSAKWITNNNSANSQGITQIKYDADIKNEDLKKIYDDLGITKDSLQTPEGAAKATLARLAFIYKTEVLGKKFTGVDDIEVSPLDALLYKYMGKNGELKNHTATPTLNEYIKNVNTYKNNFDYEGTFAMGGNLYTDLSPNMMSLWNNKQQIDQQKVNMQQMNFGLGNSFNYKNMFPNGGQLNSSDLPEDAQYYANGGTHEENPYGGIQVGVDQQGNANLVEKGEFRWHDFVFSDRINVDANLLSSFNLMPTTKHQNKKAAKGKLSYADMAKKYAKRNKELENDPITKNSMEAFMQRLANAQEYQKKAEQLEAQKQNELQDYKTALNKQNNNPMYGTMKYNGMGNAATQQGVNSGVDAGMGNPMSNADLSNVNRSGNEMMAAYGGNLFWRGGKTLNLPPYGDPESRIDYAMSYIGNPIIPNGNSRIDYANQFLQGNPPVNDYGVSDFMNRIYSGNVGSGSPKTFTSPAAQNPVTFDNWYMMQHENGKNPYVGSISSLGERVGGATTDAANNGDGQSSVGYNTASNTGRQDLTGNLGISNKVIGKTTTNTNPDAAVPSDSKEAHLYSTAGKYAQFGKGIMPMIWDWANKTNVKYDPNYRDADRLEALANEGPALRTADTIGGYRAPNLMDVERLNNSARAEGLAQMQAILDAANGNRGFVGAQSAQNNYNTQMGIGNNYVKTQEANNANRLQTDQFNHGINVANQNAINAMYQDNQRAEQTQHQAALSGTAQAAALRQRENLHADEVNTERMKNRAANQAAYVDNALNYFTTQAMENQELNTRNNDPTNPYWIDKDGRTHYVGDSGLTKAIRDEFGNDKYGRNGTFTGDRLTEWNNLTKNKKYSAKYLKEHPELWQHLVAQQREANKIDADKAEQARMEELKALRGTYQSNLARLNALKDSGAIISDPSYNLYTGWADEDYSGNQGLLRTRNQALDQYITQIGNNYDRYLYEKQLAQNQAKALGGYLNAGQNNNNNYYSYTRI